MKKKEYIIPEIHVVLLNMQQHLLTGSGTEVFDDPAPGDSQLIRMFDDFDFNFEEEEEFDYDSLD